MMKRWIAAAILITATAASLGAADLPPGKWWRRADVAQKLALTPDQQSRLDEVFRNAATDLIDRKAEVEKAAVALRGELDQPQLNRANLQRMAARLTEARGRLFERELMMLADMRGVLTEAQWTRLRQELEHVRGQRMPGRGPMRKRQ